MAQYKSFKDCLRKIERSVASASNRATNRALTSTRALYAKKARADLGLESAKVKRRSRLTKATRSNRLTTLSIGIKFMFAAHDFKVSSKAVNTRVGKRRTAQYQVKTGSKTLLPGSFVTAVNNRSTTKKLIMYRTTQARYPIKVRKVDDFSIYVNRIKPELQKHLRDSMKDNFDADVKYYLGKLK